MQKCLFCKTASPVVGVMGRKIHAQLEIWHHWKRHRRLKKDREHLQVPSASKALERDNTLKQILARGSLINRNCTYSKELLMALNLHQPCRKKFWGQEKGLHHMPAIYSLILELRQLSGNTALDLSQRCSGRTAITRTGNCCIITLQEMRWGSPGGQSPWLIHISTVVLAGTSPKRASEHNTGLTLLMKCESLCPPAPEKKNSFCFGQCDN